MDNSPITLKRKRPHEDTVDAAGKRRAIYNPMIGWGNANTPGLFSSKVLSFIFFLTLLLFS